LIVIAFLSFGAILYLGTILRGAWSSENFDWQDYMRRISALDRLRFLYESYGERLKSFKLGYDMSVRYLYMLAVVNGRKDIAEELVKKYELLDSPERS
jgi:hypothetical protein